MKKKCLLVTIFVFLITVFAFTFTACNKVTTLEELQNEFGIFIEGGGFEKGSELNFEILTEDQADEIFDLLEDCGIALDDTTKTYVYDIFVTKGGSEVQPNGDVKVSVPAPVDEKATGYNVYHVKDNGAVESIPSTFKNGKITFETDGFSCYVFTPTYNVITYTLATYSTITIDTNTITNGTISVNGEPINELYKDGSEVGSTILLKADADEGYELYCWFIQGERCNTVHENEFTYTVTTEDVSITAVFKPIITELSLTYFDDTFVYDLDLVKGVETITIEQFYHESPANNYYLVAGILDYFSSNGNIRIKDEHGNVIQAELSDSVITTETYEIIKNKRNKFVALYGYKNEELSFKMTDATLAAFIPDFSKEQIKGISVEGTNVIENGSYFIEGDCENEIDWEKPGEYAVKYCLASNPEICKTITVKVLGESTTFTAWVNNGTMLLDGADIGSRYTNKFRNGYGKITLTAKSDEHTLFKGWYLLDGNDNTLISKDVTCTFEFNKETVVWCEFEHVASEIVLDGANSGFDTISGVTGIYLPVENRVFDLEQIGVCAIIKGEPEYLTLDDYIIDDGGFNANNLVAGVYVVTFTYKANPSIKATHIIQVFGEGGAINVDVSVDAGGRLASELAFSQYNVGDQITLTVELRSETEYEFLGWYSIVNGVSEATSSETLLSADRTYVHTAMEDVSIRAKIEPKITRLYVLGYEGNPTRINIEKFWMATREFIVRGFGALGTNKVLSESEYSVDFGGLDVNNPVVGKYVITYTYNENPDVKYFVTVYVWEEDYSFVAHPSSPNFGKLIFENEITAEAVGNYVQGESVTIKAIANEGFTFMGWYEVVGQEEYVFISAKAEYTFVIDKDVELVAKFDAPVTSISLEGTFMDNYGNYYIDATEGDGLDLSNVIVLAESMAGSVALNQDEYSIDYGGLNVSNLVFGTYTLVYTHTDSNLKTTLTVNVYKRTYCLNVRAEGGRFEYDGEETSIMNQYFEDGSIVILKAVEYENNAMRVFLGWYEYDLEDRVWKIFSTDKNVAVTVDGAKRILVKYGYATVGIEVYETDFVTENGVSYINIEPDTYYDEELGCYVCTGSIEVEIGSEYVENLAKIFEDVTLITTNSNGNITEVSANDLIIELGAYKPEIGWYNIVVKYGTLTIKLYVSVW